MSHLHSRIGHETPFSAAKISLHPPLRLPSAFTVNHDLEGATFRRWLPLDRPLQERMEVNHLTGSAKNPENIENVNVW